MKDTLFSQQMEYLKAATCSPAAFEAYQFNKRLENSLEERIREKKGLSTGDVLRGTQFGDFIFSIACDKEYKNYLEIGPCCGRGTTKCFLDGIIPRKDEASLQSIESNVTFYNITQNYWIRYFEYKTIDPKKLNLILGTLIPYEELDDNYITDGGETKTNYDYNIDIKSAPLIKIEKTVDVLCLDGGHFSTLPEWELFKDQIKVIILDDTNTSKSRKIADEINSNNMWNVIYAGSGRNGELIAKKSS